MASNAGRALVGQGAVALYSGQGAGPARASDGVRREHEAQNQQETPRRQQRGRIWRRGRDWHDGRKGMMRSTH